ncbi:hypothetical protein IWW55_002367 [Coemansia sp. RSA 2706]|nr:hypothetical protein IWW55_002367 [Coemansia sp. RSA 2706]
MLKQLANGHELDNVGQVSVLEWINPQDCDRVYQLAIWMLLAILETGVSWSPSASFCHSKWATDMAEQEVGKQDWMIIKWFIVSVVRHCEVLQRWLMQQAAEL